ncbi:hypothetical protein [Flavobacterium notoginsengisoli]|uniref:hypothetical protein n=1 Tax=Flavobacterium notoginsengisoli TaxID=1478199 RepID=UPI0036403DA5
MKNLQIKLVLFLLLSLNVCCQSIEGESTSVILQLNEFRKIEETSKEILKNIASSKYEVIKIRNEEQPKVYAEMADSATKIYSGGNEINDYIEEIKSRISEEDCFVTNDTTLYDEFVKQKYAILKSKIDLFYKQNKVIIASAKRYDSFKEDNEAFNTNKIFINKEDKKVNFLNYKFGYKANIGLLTSLEKIQFEVVHFQYMFMNANVGSAH